jgi:hypothetical protein
MNRATVWTKAWIICFNPGIWESEIYMVGNNNSQDFCQRMLLFKITHRMPRTYENPSLITEYVNG